MDADPKADGSGWWIAYFIVSVMLALAGPLFASRSPLVLLAFIFNGFGLVGLWGYLEDQAIGWRRFWVAYAQLVLLSVSVGLGPALWYAFRDDFGLFCALAIGGVVSVPQWWAIWRYAFRSPHIWRPPSASN